MHAEGIVPAKMPGSSHAQRDVDSEIATFKNYLTRKEPSLRVTKKALTTVATWADTHNKPVMLGDIPWGLKRNNLMQTHHLTTLRDINEAAMYESHD